MEKSKIVLSNITDFLGCKEDRYFSNGFKSIDILYGDVIYENNILTTSIKVQCKKNWSQKNGLCLKPHLGTTEFISIAATVSQQLLENKLGLNTNDIETSWISRFTCKVKKCENIDYSHIPVSGKFVSTTPLEGFCESCINVHIGSLSVMLYVRHPFLPSTSEPVDGKKIDLYKRGYKLRDHSITDVILDKEEMVTVGSVYLSDSCRESRKGLGAKYMGMILTDFVLITGQLTQALLYNMNKIKRAESNNLWLREIDVWCEEPQNETKCHSEIRFLNINIIQKDNKTWQSVTLSGKLGRINSKIKVAQKIK